MVNYLVTCLSFELVRFQLGRSIVKKNCLVVVLFSDCFFKLRFFRLGFRLFIRVGLILRILDPQRKIDDLFSQESAIKISASNLK
jgi:hypothetical protein